MTKPTQGRWVTLKGAWANNKDEHPALITAVHASHDPASGQPVLVNLTAFYDLVPACQCHGSVMLFDTRREAEAYRADNPRSLVCFWPDRVS